MRPFAAALVPIALAALAAAVPARAQTFEDRVAELVNQERWDNGQLPPLKRCALLDSSSETHSSDMAERDFFAHCDLDTGSMPWDRMTDAGYTGWSYAAENIAAGYSTPEAVMAAWMGSSGHRANILSTDVREIGIGYVLQDTDQADVRLDSNGDCTADGTGGPYFHYWTQNFGRRNSVYPVVIEREAYETTTRNVALYLYGSGWAQDMRFRNEDGAWSDWEPFAADKAWTLSAQNGVKTVWAEIRNGSTVYDASDEIVLNAPVTAVPPGDEMRLPRLVLHPASPNPFRSATRLAYDLPRSGPVRITVFDVSGRRVAALLDAVQTEGRHEATWNGRNASGVRCRSGVYLIVVRAGGETQGAKVLLGR